MQIFQYILICEKVCKNLTKKRLSDIIKIIILYVLYIIMSLDNIEIEKSNAADTVEQKEEALLKEINNQITDIKLESIDAMTQDQLTKFIKKEFQTTEWKRFTYSKMKEKWSFYAFSLESAIDFISDKLGDKKYTSEWKEDSDGSKWGKSLDDRLKENWGIDATDDAKNIAMITLLQKILWITADWFAGPETMANITALLEWSTLSSISVEWYDEKNPYGYTQVSTLISGWEASVDAENASVYALQDKITAYTKASTPEAKTAIESELEAYLMKTYTNYTDKTFHKNLAIALLTKQSSFTWNTVVYYPVVDAEGKVTIVESSDEAKAKQVEIENNQKETKRIKNAKEYSEKLFPETLSIAQAGDVFYITLPEVKPPLLSTPAIIWQIRFPSKENAQKFIDLSKAFIQKYGYAMNKNSRAYLWGKWYYLDSVKDLFVDKFSIKNMFKNIDVQKKISEAIDGLACWTNESWTNILWTNKVVNAAATKIVTAPTTTNTTTTANNQDITLKWSRSMI